MSKNHHIQKKEDSKEKEEKQIHDQEHATWNRRTFIQALGLVGAGSMTLGHAAITATKPSPLSVALSEVDNDNILVIVRLKGGNDGLNTIVPVYDYATYVNLRPTLRYDQNDLLNLDADFAIPNFMNSLESMWGDGQMKVVHGVGYPEQNLSHFRSSEIWASTNEVNFEPTGWWGRYYEDLYPDYLVNPPEDPPAIQIGSIGNLIFEGDNNNYAFSVANPNQLTAVAENGTLHNVLNLPDCVYGDMLLFMRSTANTTFVYSQVLHDAYLSSNNDAPYEDAELSNQLAIVARMIKGGLKTKVYMVTLNGFDTHANQIDGHRALMEDLSKSIKNFYTDLGTTGVDDKVLTMTISEFGRRPYENGSFGTDHGAASPVLLFGAGLQGSGFVGDHPSLTQWDNDDNLIPTSHFRDIYSTVLTDWFCLDPSIVSQILLNQTFNSLDLGLVCEASPITDSSNITRFTHVPVYQNNRTYIEINMPYTGHVDIKLYDIIGREIGTLANEILFMGEHKIDVRAKIKSHLSYGQYIYRIASGGEFYSKSILIK